MHLDTRELGAIFAGGFIGAALRAELGELLPHGPGGWPWATLLVNVAGAFLLGYFVTRLQERLPLSAYRRPFLGTGDLRRPDDVLDDADRAAADARRRSRRARGRLRDHQRHGRVRRSCSWRRTSSAGRA